LGGSALFRLFRRKREVEEETPEEVAAETADEAAEGGPAVAIAEAEAAVSEAAEPEAEPEAELSEEDLERTEAAVERTKRSWFGRIGQLFTRGSLDEEDWEELEALLLGADVGVHTTERVLERLRERVARDRIRDPETARQALADELVAILDLPGRGKLWRESDDGGPVPRPAVILVVGVNGAGKTTSIGKLAYAFKLDGESVLIGAADTFRAAAIDQMKVWGERVGVDVVAHRPGADPGAVAFDTLAAAESRGADVVLIDTAGRLHTKFNLMEELRKIRRVLERKDPTAPHEVLLVLDATTGQNGLMQAKAFTEAVDVTAVCLAKLDSTAKGGIVFAVADELGIPVRFVGTGEKVSDLAPFEPHAFVHALLS
jgi:fused signal recognition particle receptor